MNVIEDFYRNVPTKKWNMRRRVQPMKSRFRTITASRLKAVGMLSNTEYPQGEADYLEKEANKNVASMSLYQTVETYQGW